MKRAALYILLATSCIPVFNARAVSLQEQLAAVAAAENEGKAQEQQKKEYRREKRRQHRANVRAAAAARRAAVNASNAKREAAIAADKKRDQTYEDALRRLELENRRLELQAKSTRVKRENDFVDQDLKERAARTDVIQSEADATRNLSSGGKKLMQSEGKAREKEAGSWW